jgi:hypothetical protein
VKHSLPALALRTTRVRLLAATYEDAIDARRGTAAGDALGSHLNLHDELWTMGSYQELDMVIACMNGRRRGFTSMYLTVAFKHQPAGVPDVLQYVADGMPRNIFVPPEVAENAGYLASEAGMYAMPDSEQRRRWARKPTRAV